MKKIKLTKEKYALVDTEDYDWLNQYKWHSGINTDKKIFYAITYLSKNKQHIQMARFIMDCPKGMVVDHINGNQLDNRKKNLRICTQHQNSMNRKLNKNNFKGTYYDKYNNK